MTRTRHLTGVAILYQEEGGAELGIEEYERVAVEITWSEVVAVHVTEAIAVSIILPSVPEYFHRADSVCVKLFPGDEESRFGGRLINPRGRGRYLLCVPELGAVDGMRLVDRKPRHLSRADY